MINTKCKKKPCPLLSWDDADGSRGQGGFVYVSVCGQGCLADGLFTLFVEHERDAWVRVRLV